jgi:hypothetical protein
LEQLPAAEHLARCPREETEEVEFPGSEPDGGAVHGDLAGGVVHHQAADGEDCVGRLEPPGAPNGRPDAGDELAGSDGLHDVVVGTEVEARGTVGVTRSRADDEDGRATDLCEFHQQIESRLVRQAEVEEDHCRLEVVELLSRMSCRGRFSDDESAVGEQVAYDRPEVGVIVHHQDDTSVRRHLGMVTSILVGPSIQ